MQLRAPEIRFSHRSSAGRCRRGPRSGPSRRSRTARRGAFANYSSGATTLAGRRRRCPFATSFWRRRGRARRSYETSTRTWGFRRYAARRCRFRPHERCSMPRRRIRSRGSVATAPLVPGTRRCPIVRPSGPSNFSGHTSRFLSTRSSAEFQADEHASTAPSPATRSCARCGVVSSPRAARRTAC